ncbi:MAG: RNA polymerase sigma factor [Cyclobacteriaceae bacterium]|nr:RNA polymerase sigma factor [Cyclobacteriaceae bacterium HetDA_MAG_MS6]
MSKTIDLLWKRLVDKDKNAIEAIYKAYHAPLFAYCLGKLKQVDLAENAVADIFIKIIEFPDHSTIQVPENWIYTLARNVCNTHWNKQNRRARILDEIKSMFSVTDKNFAEDRIDLSIIDRIIKKSLKERDYQIWRLYGEGYDNREIGKRLSMNEKTVANRKANLKLQLKRVLEEYDLGFGN